MISRRALLGTGATVAGGAALVVAAERTHRLDDVARALGARPKPEPDPRDDRIVARIAAELAALSAQLTATAARHASLELAPFVAIGAEHLQAVGGAAAAKEASPVPGEKGPAREALVAAHERVGSLCVRSSGAARSPDLARVLASMSAGLEQCARAIGGLR